MNDSSDPNSIQGARSQSPVSTFDEGIILQLADGTIQACNSTAEAILGLNLEQIQAWISIHNPWQTIHEDGTPFLKEAHPALIALQTSQPQQDVIMGVYQPDAALIWLNVTAQPLFQPAQTDPYAVVLTFRRLLSPQGIRITTQPPSNITPTPSPALVRSQISEFEAIKLFHLSIDLLGVASLDSQFRQVNPAFQRILGYSIEEVLAQPFLNFIHPEDQAKTIAELEKLNAGATTIFFETRCRCKNGAYKWLEWTAVPIVSAGIVYVTGRDVTERKTLEAALQAANETLEQRVAERTTELEKLNQILHNSEVRFRSAVDHMPDVFVIYDAERRIQFVNAAGLALAERPIEDFLGRKDEEIFPPEVTHSYLPLLEQTVATKAYQTGECTISLPNRLPYTIAVQYMPLLDTQGEIQQILGITYNITERKQAEEAMRRSEQQVRHVLDSLFSFVGVMTPDGILIEANRTALEAAALQPDDVLGKPFEDAYWWSYSIEVQNQLRQAIVRAAAGETIRYDVVVRVRDGQLITIDFTLVPILNQGGQVEFLIPSGIDITERKQAEMALRRSEERYRSLFESIDEGFCIVEVLFDEHNTAIDYRFLEINPAFERHTGLVDAQGKTARELLPNLEDHWFEIYGNVALTGEPYRFENGSEVMKRWFDVFAFRFGAPQQRQVAIRFKDISDRKTVEVERERVLQREQAAREAAERANRIKDEFLAVLSHELRTPLNPILGWTKLLQSGKLDATKTANALNTIVRNATLQSQLIEDLLDVSRILRGKLTLNVAPVTLSTTILAALETVRLAAEAKDIHLHSDIAADVGKVSGDAGRLQQVVWNLLSNAVKFTPARGRVEVRLSRLDHLAQIQVIDSGKGIQPDFLPYVFEHFRQEEGGTTRTFGGLGLGLAIARQIVELHGGTIEAESAGIGQGATFTVTLPLMRSEALLKSTEQADEVVATLSLTLAGLRILVVDDDPDSREFVSFVLAQEGAEVITVSSSFEVLQALKQHQFDLLASDIGMPEVDGYMLLRQVRQLPLAQGSRIPAIAITAYAGDFNQDQAFAAGFQAHLSKPIDPTTLVATVIRLIRNSSSGYSSRSDR